MPTKSIVLLAILLPVAKLHADEAPPRAGKYTALFDGGTLDGWEGNEQWFRIEDGAIVAGNVKERIPRNEFLATKKEFGDFELRFQARQIGQGKNAGVQFRSQRVPDSHEMIGYQCDIGRWSKGLIWGLIYDESRRRKMLTSVDQKELAKHVNVDGWNQLIVLAQGPRIRIWVNGFQTADYTEMDESIDRRGRLGLQIHGGPPAECWYKSIEIKEL